MLQISIIGTRAGKAPTFRLERLEGGYCQLPEDAGNGIILLEFWGTCCKAKLGNLQYLNNLQDKYKDRGLHVYAINIDDATAKSHINPVVKRYGYTFPILLDPHQEILRMFSPSKTKPFTVVIGRDGTIIRELSGETPGNWKLVEETIQALCDIK